MFALSAEASIESFMLLGTDWPPAVELMIIAARWNSESMLWMAGEERNKIAVRNITRYPRCVA